MSTATHRPRLSPVESIAVKVVTVSTVGFGCYGFATGAPSVVSYMCIVLGLALLIRAIRTAPLPDALAVALAVLAIAHLAGGLVRVGDDVLYNASIGPQIASLHTHVLQYDHFVHGFGTFVAALTLWTLLAAPHSSASSRRDLVTLCVLAGIGVGGVNEMIEFLATTAHSGAHVGGYVNTGWDLVSNAIGAAVAASMLERGRSFAPSSS